MKRALVVFTCCGFTMANLAYAGPFGVDMGTPLAKLRVVKGLGSDGYQVQVPKPNSEFDQYIVVAKPSVGVCNIIAAGKTHSEDVSGVETQMAYRTLKAQLTAKYRPSTSYDFLHAGALWDKPYEWSRSIYHKERTFADIWVRKTSRLPADINGILLDVHAVTSDGPYINLAYEFANFKQCTEADKKRDQDAL